MQLPAAALALNPAAFNSLITAYGVRLLWKQGHACPCVMGNPIQPGSPDPQCVTCSGRGWYWNSPVGPFVGLITFMHISPSPDEPGATMDEKLGIIQRSEPSLTIPSSETLPWTNATLNDIFVEIDAIDRFESALTVGSVQAVPYQEQLTIAPSGAVTMYDTTTHSVVAVSGYTVSGAAVLLPSSYGPGTSYVVQFSAAKTYVAWRNAGSIGHDRPFAQLAEPKRFRCQTLDLWLRART